MIKSDSLWIAAFLLGFIASFGVFNPTPGIGLFIGVNALVAALWYFGAKNVNAKELKKTPESKTLLMVLTGFYVALTVPYLYRLDFSVVGVLIAVHTVFLVFGALYFALPSALHMLDILSLIVSPIAFGLNWLVESVKSFFELFKDGGNVVRLMLKVVLYAAASLIIFIFFAKLLSAADAEFKIRIDKILDSLDLVIVMQRTLIGVVLSFVSAGLLAIIGMAKILPMFGTTTERAKEMLDKAFSFVSSRRSDAILPIIVTAPLLFLFALYVWVQFSYLFGKDLAEILATYSFATYARRGFAELLIVSALSYPLLSWSMSQSRSEWKLPRFVTFLINSGIVSMLVVMLYSLITRITLYMQVYGPSVLRTYVVVGAIFAGVALVAYELLAAMKTLRPSFAVFHGRLMNDFVIAALITALSLLAAISYYPWSKYVAHKLQIQYETVGKVDVFQLKDLPLEAQSNVYQFGKTLETDGLKEAGLLLQASAIQEVSTYRGQRADSIFPAVFGFNLSQFPLYQQVPENGLETVKKDFTRAMNDRINVTTESFRLAIEGNNFTSARTYFDPEMVPNDIVSFTNAVTLVRADSSSFFERFDSGFSPAEQFLSGSKATSDNFTYTLLREGKKSPEMSMSLTYSFRNGQVVVTDGTLILSYLPDAISPQGDNYEVAAYGYRTFCKVPTLEVIYSNNSGCSDPNSASYARETAQVGMVKPDMYYENQPMGQFLKSDFVTEAKQ